MERWRKGRFKTTIKKLSQFDNKKPDELESEFDHFDVGNSYRNSPFKGRLIVNLDFVYKQLLEEHIACKTTLSSTQYQKQKLVGLISILYLSLQNCSAVTIVKTNIYDVNTNAGINFTCYDPPGSFAPKCVPSPRAFAQQKMPGDRSNK